MIVPSKAPTFTEAMRQGAEVYQKLKSLAKKRYGQSAGNVGDEGGVAPDIQTPEEALDLITDAIAEAGYTGQIDIAMDVASSEFYREGKYDLDFKVATPPPLPRMISVLIERRIEPRLRQVQVAHLPAARRPLQEPGL